MLEIGKYSFGIGDRFAHQGVAQLKAIMKAKEKGIDIVPVWNKSNREHITIHSSPSDVRYEADQAVKELNWNGQYFVDADHVNIQNIDSFIDSSDFFTLDVADYIGQQAEGQLIEDFVKNCKSMVGNLVIPGVQGTFTISNDLIHDIAKKYLHAVKQAGIIYKNLVSKKGEGNFITEVSMDEVAEAQTPVELLFILKAIADEGIPAQTIAPKFTGRFNKGVDYVGDVKQFAKEFEEDILIVDYAVRNFGLPANLKLSVHSGSDKFSIYPFIGDIIRKYDKGIHVKTAGTTWLEELIGLALPGEYGLQLAKDIYKKAFDRFNELCIPYENVIDIKQDQLPNPSEVQTWNGQKFANTLRHIPGNPAFNPSFRQLLHVGYKVAAEYVNIYTNALDENKDIIEQQVIENIYDRHIKRLFNL